MTDKTLAGQSLQGLELRSLITASGELRVTLEPVAFDGIGPEEVVVRIEASPINPSDLGMLLGPADRSTIQAKPNGGGLTASVPADRLASIKARLDQSMVVGNEGAGTVIAAGTDAQSLLGKKVTLVGGGMYTQLRKMRARDCVVLPDDVSSAEGASTFVNPMTSLSMVDAMRREGHTALIHTAAASNLGQMLVKICLADNVGLVNIVRSAAQVETLRDLGAKYVVDSTAATFEADLVDAIAATGASIAFDAIGGGTLANRILHAMEAAAIRNQTNYDRYGSKTFKQVYIYGGLDTGPTVLDRGVGMSWAVGGFLVGRYLEKVGRETAQTLRARVIRELKTTFASHYTTTISLRDVLDMDYVNRYAKFSTGEKYLIDPSRDQA